MSDERHEAPAMALEPSGELELEKHGLDIPRARLCGTHEIIDRDRRRAKQADDLGPGEH